MHKIREHRVATKLQDQALGMAERVRKLVDRVAVGQDRKLEFIFRNGMKYE